MKMRDPGKHRFFHRMEQLGLALTYDDVRLKTGYSTVMPDSVCLQSRFSVNVPLNVPIVSAAMDTVTEADLAIEMARCGGLGVIHRNLSPVDQAAHVARVKHHLNGLITRPICVREDETIEAILRRRDEKRYPFHSFLVLDQASCLVGVLTGNDFDFCDDVSRMAGEVMTREVQTAAPGITIDDAYALMQTTKRKLLPIIDARRQVRGLYTFSDVKRIKSGRSAINNVGDRGQLRVGAAVGTAPEELERVELLVRENIDVVVIDTAHGDSIPVYRALKQIKDVFPGLDVVVGNVTEPDSARRLIEAGADGIKVGQGPGSICTTRVIAGVGCPQVTAIYHCANAAGDIPVCADGGITQSGDIPIAIGAGAHCVMLGKMLAGTKEAPGDIVFYQSRQQKAYRGMGSVGAMQSSAGSRQRYNQSHVIPEELVPEGVEGLVPYTGELRLIFHQMTAGLRRGMGYVGAASIDELREKADFRRLTAAGKAESHPHDIAITREAPNYSRDK